MHRTRLTRSGSIGGHTSLQRSRSYTGCRSSTVSPSKLLLSCIRLSTIDAHRTSLTLSCLLRSTRMYANFDCSTTRTAAVKRSRTQRPATIRTIDSHPAFRRALKTHLFRSAFTFTLTLTLQCTIGRLLIYMTGQYIFYDVM